MSGNSIGYIHICMYLQLSEGINTATLFALKIKILKASREGSAFMIMMQSSGKMPPALRALK